MRIAIDTGGTFTDCVYLERGELRVRKVFSTPGDPAQAVRRGVEQVAAPDAPVAILHGTTVGTNTLLERKGARVAFVTTAGFEDTLGIGRQARPRLYDLFAPAGVPLAPPELWFGVAERMLPDGRAHQAPATDDLKRLREAIAATRPDSVAVSLLFSFANPAHESEVAKALSQLGVPISLSHQILPEFREYERASTVVVNAYLAPRMSAYLLSLERWASGRRGSVHLMQSSGGITPARVAAREPVRTVLSGPAGGVVGAHAVARRAGLSRIISFDMGGTSTDVALVEDAPPTSSEAVVAGLPVAVPMLDIHTVGAGGGSIARFDAGGALRVGPESAGADPGPICYGRGEQPTVTDANLLLGRLDPEFFLGGEMRLDLARTQKLFEAFVARHRRHTSSVQALAEGIVRVANASMEKAIRVISIERGYDSREFTLVSFGGAGGLHACALASALRMARVLVPQHPGALSAVGILFADVVKDFSRTVMLPAGAGARLARHFKELERNASRAMREEGLSGRTVRMLRSLDMRYVGQGYEVRVPWQKRGMSDAFHRAHEIRYGYADCGRAVEIVNARLRLIAPAAQPKLLAAHVRKGNGRQAVAKRARYTIVDRAKLRPGDRLAGPAVIAEYSGTTFLPLGFSATVDGWSNLLLERK